MNDALKVGCPRFVLQKHYPKPPKRRVTPVSRVSTSNLPNQSVSPLKRASDIIKLPPLSPASTFD